MDGAPEGRRYACALLDALKAANITIVPGLPDSRLRAVHRMLGEDPEIHYIPVASEAEMPGIAAGAYLGGKRAAMIMENSGLRQMCEPLSRFALTHHIPLLMIMSFRGDLGERYHWGHSHAQTMVPLLTALNIPYWLVSKINEIKDYVIKSWTHTESSQWPVALIMRDECSEA